MDSAKPHEPVCVLGVRLHVLIDGATFNVRTREAKAPPNSTRSDQR